MAVTYLGLTEGEGAGGSGRPQKIGGTEKKRREGGAGGLDAHRRSGVRKRKGGTSEKSDRAFT